MLCRAALLPLIKEGFVEIVHGGAEAGIFLSNHAAITHIHLTGSGKTYDAVVWGKQPKVCPFWGKALHDSRAIAEALHALHVLCLLVSCTAEGSRQSAPQKLAQDPAEHMVRVIGAAALCLWHGRSCSSPLQAALYSHADLRQAIPDPVLLVYEPRGST